MAKFKDYLFLLPFLVFVAKGEPVTGPPENAECLLDVTCSEDKVCLNSSCADPCTLCGNNTLCHILGKTPICLCKPCFSGNPVVGCTRLCKEECTVDGDCAPEKACIDGSCICPCVQACGEHAECTVKNHHAVCSCKTNHTWFNGTSCVAIESPPECHKNADCKSEKNCQGGRCVDTCEGMCGVNAVCRAANHLPACACPPGYSGDPFTYCKPRCYTTSDGLQQNRSFLLVQSTGTRYQAFQGCKSRGMSLVSIHSFEEQIAVTEFLAMQNTFLGDVWTSGVRGPTGVVWSRPNPYGFIPYTCWRQEALSYTAVGFCVYLSYGSGYSWNTWRCGDNHEAYLCEEVCS